MKVKRIFKHKKKQRIRAKIVETYVSKTDHYTNQCIEILKFDTKKNPREKKNK